MNWEQKLAALNAITECSLRMRKPGDWYVYQGLELKQGNMLSGAYGNGATPEEAVLDHWKELVEPASCLKPIVYNAYGADRREIYWNGFMWCDCPKRSEQKTV